MHFIVCQDLLELLAQTRLESMFLGIDPVFCHSPGFYVAVEHSHPVTRLGQLFGCEQTCRTRTDNRRLYAFHHRVSSRIQCLIYFPLL